MKTIIRKFATLFALAAMVVGCQKDLTEESTTIPSGGILVASPSKGVVSRVSESPNANDALGYKVSWEVGDKLYVSDEAGDTLIGVYEVKTATNINSDGSAIFQAKEASTPLLDEGVKYQFLATDAEIDESYNDYIAATRESFKEYSADVTDANNLVTSLLYSKSALSVGSGLMLSHLFSYVRVGAKISDATMPKARFSYVDSEGESYSQTLSLDKFNSSLIEDDTYIFNITILPATISEANPICLEVSADGESYTTQKELTKDCEFVAGVHYDFSGDVTPTKNEIIVDSVAKPITGNYFEFMGDFYGCRLSSSHSDQRLSYSLSPWSEIHFTDYKEHMFEMVVVYENTGELDFDLANPDFSSYHNGMMIESTIAGKGSGEAVEGVELKIMRDDFLVTASYIPNLRDPDYLNYKYKEDNTFIPTPATIKSGSIKSSLIWGTNIFLCDVTLTIEFEIGGVAQQRTFTISSNGEYKADPIDESKFNNTISLNNVSKSITATLQVSKGDAEIGGNPYVDYIFSAEHSPEQLLDEYFNGSDSDEPSPFVHRIFTNVPSVTLDSSDPSSYEMLGYNNTVEVSIQNTGDTGIGEIWLCVRTGELTAELYDVSGSAAINKCILEYNVVGDKASYKLDLDMTITIDDVEYDKVIKAEYAGAMGSVPVAGIEMESEMMLIEGKSGSELYCNVMPNEALNHNITLTSSDESVATVEKYTEPWGDVYYVVSHKAGTTIITATTEDGGHEATCTVTVVPSLIDVTPREAAIGAEGGVVTIEITTDEKWRVTSYETLVDESQRSGTGNATITINIPEETSTGGYRDIYIETVDSGYYDYDYVRITQSGANE